MDNQQSRAFRQKYHWSEYIIYLAVTIGFALLGLVVAIVAGILMLFSMTRKKLTTAKRLALVFSLALALSVLTGVWMYYHQRDLGQKSVSITVSENMTFSQLTAQLQRRGVIEHPRLFKVLARIRGLDKRLWVGRYDFAGEVSLASVIADLSAGKIASVMVTIPEGKNIQQTAALLSEALELDSASIVSLCLDSAKIQERYGVPDLEGYLLPETYRLPVGVSAEEVIKQMAVAAVEELRILRTRYPERAETDRELVILASIIEAEARVGRERRTISSVYHNRLKKRMLLQADPTVRYALKRYRKKLYHKHLAIDHPYNTYQRRGLPPGPINSPGAKSLEAAFNPETTDYFYFVADGSGGHIFSRTLREHNNARLAIKKNR